jgi:ABC-type dipeptide/oligopeptide/nickel transport system permease subunit
LKKRRNTFLWMGIVYLAALALVAIVVPFVQDPTNRVAPMPARNLNGQVVMTSTFLPPSSAHWLGTDQSGRDVFALLAQGARTSLTIGILVELVVLTVGMIVAVLGVYAPKWLGAPLMRFTDAMFAFPDILLALLLLGIFRSLPIPVDSMWFSLFNGGFIPLIIALSITAWPGIVRIMRGQLLSLKDREFVVAAKANGASTTYLVMKHILPQLWGLLLAISMVELAGVILAESTLSFIGIGVQPPNPSWGNMIDKARQDMVSHPALLFYPCLVLSITIFALNFVGDGLRTLADPKGK